METLQFWKLIDQARAQVPDPACGDAVACEAAALLALSPVPEILAAGQTLWDLMAASYRAPLWGAAYVINGGCSDDLFDYFRGWLIIQGRQTFEAAVADPDHLADLPSVRALAKAGIDAECEETLAIAWNAYRTATGEQPPSRSFTIRYPALDPDWDFDFDRSEELARRLPRLAALYAL